MPDRRSFLVSLLALSALPLAGCVTRAMLESGTVTHMEEISSLLLSQDEAHLIAASGDHHYIFPAPPQIVATLKKSFHPYVTAVFSSFSVDGENQVSGTVTLRLAGAPQSAIDEAIASGYRPGADGASLVCELKGKRYAAGATVLAQRYQLNTSYQVPVRVPEGGAARAAKLLLTPVTVTIDGVLLLFGVPLGLLALSVACKEGGCR